MLVGMKDTRQARVGDTWHAHRRPVPPLPGFKPAKSMVYAGGWAGAAASLASARKGMHWRGGQQRQLWAQLRWGQCCGLRPAKSTVYVGGWAGGRVSGLLRARPPRACSRHR